MTENPAPGSRRPLWIGLAVLMLAGVVGFFVWRHLSPRQSTDDAQVTGHVTPVAARVGGTIKDIRIHDNQVVKAGDVLVEIDPRDYEIALALAEADLAAAKAASQAARSDVPITSATATNGLNIAQAGAGAAEAGVRAADRQADAARAKVTAAKARLAEAQAHATRAKQDLDRLQPLAAKDEIPRQQLDAAVAASHVASAAVDSAAADVGEAEANLDAAEARRGQTTGALSQAQAQARAAATAPQQIALTEARAASADAGVMQAQAAVDQARLNLERTTVRATASGVVSKRSVEPGQVVQAGQPLLSLTTLDDVWVTANFKETQLDSIHPGQPADVEVDAYDGRRLSGRVESIAAATGATFSLLPPDNASGNFVKVVQRIPVKIVLDHPSDAATVLRPGMSVTATVYLR
jgi:membrane fusion protein (multidrug efflux system)